MSNEKYNLYLPMKKFIGNDEVVPMGLVYVVVPAGRLNETNREFIPW